MSNFADEEKRNWTVRVDVTGIRQVRGALDINLGDLSQAADNFVKMGDDPCLLCNVLFVLCEEQAKDRNVSDADFGRLLAGDVIFDATMALEEAITDFFPRKKRSILQRLRKKVNRVQEMGTELVVEKLEEKGLEEKILARMKMQMESLIHAELTPLSSASSLPDKPE